MSDEKQIIRCRLCGKEHETAMLYGMTIVPCPEMPKDIILPHSTLDAFLDGQSMLDQPLIVVK